MPQRILAENWSDYDNRKIRDKRDARDFACTEEWEVEYLVNKIRKVYPHYREVLIRSAILRCCEILKAPHPRHEFVGCVMSKLRET